MRGEVEKSGRKWTFLNILYQIIKVLPKGLSTSHYVPFAETLCYEEITRHG